MNEILKKIENFHGHLGPYVVIGYRMGHIANEKFGTDPFLKKATVFTGCKPPISCIVDGIQLSSGCTLGKGNIKVDNKNQAKVIFSNKKGETLEIKLKDSVKNEIDKVVTDENMVDFSQNLYKKSDLELFEVL